MFERYTENARRTIFFALREASAVGSPTIETAHLLVGLLEAAPEILVGLSAGSVTPEALRSRPHAPPAVDAPGEMATDRPLSSASRQVLFLALEEADHRHDRHIGTEHLLAGLLRDKRDPTAKLLRELGSGKQAWVPSGRFRTGWLRLCSAIGQNLKK